jgi:hypothetical protein
MLVKPRVILKTMQKKRELIKVRDLDRHDLQNNLIFITYDDDDDVRYCLEGS